MGEILIAAYFFCGMVYAIFEAQTFEYEEEFGNLPKLDTVFSITVMVAHLLRAGLVFPLYVLEDFCISRLNKAAEERGEL